jgi:peptidoglycan L-alanyl-D-glutamate endopeptidase CwlK
MANYGHESISELGSTHPDIQKVMLKVVKRFDNTIVYGYRNPGFQFELYKKGRSFIKGKWIITDLKAVVTYKDGTKEVSKHNTVPAEAVDAIPYPIDWTDTKRMCYFAGWVMSITAEMFEKGEITHEFRWGNDWDRDTEIRDETFNDLCHFEIIT